MTDTTNNGAETTRLQELSASISDRMRQIALHQQARDEADSAVTRLRLELAKDVAERNRLEAPLLPPDTGRRGSKLSRGGQPATRAPRTPRTVNPAPPALVPPAETREPVGAAS